MYSRSIIRCSPAPLSYALFRTSLSSFAITEKLEPPVFTRQLTKKDVREGQRVKFDAQVKGNPMPEIEWFRNDEKLEMTDRLRWDT